MNDETDQQPREQITTKIWREEPEPDNPFAASACYCAGYDVFGDLLGKISLIEYIWLIFKLDPPTSEQARLFESLAVAHCGWCGVGKPRPPGPQRPRSHECRRRWFNPRFSANGSYCGWCGQPGWQQGSLHRTTVLAAMRY